MGGTNEAEVGLWGVGSLTVLQVESGSGRKRIGLWWQNKAAGQAGFRRRNGRIGSAVGASRRVLRTQSVGSAAAEKVSAAAEKSAAAAEKRTAVSKCGGCGGGETAAGTPRRRPGKSPAGEMKRLTRRTRSAYPGFFPAHGGKWPAQMDVLPCKGVSASL